MAALKKGARITGAERTKLATDLRKQYDKGRSIRELAEQQRPFIRLRASGAVRVRDDLARTWRRHAEQEEGRSSTDDWSGGGPGRGRLRQSPSLMPSPRITLNRRRSSTPRRRDTWRGWPRSAPSCPGRCGSSSSTGAGPVVLVGLDRRLARRRARRVARLPWLEARRSAPTTPIADYQAAFGWLARPRLVSIAAVHGHAVGAGFQLALACDLRVVADDAQFTMAEPRFGMVPDLGGTKRLVDLVGYCQGRGDLPHRRSAGRRRGAAHRPRVDGGAR